MKLICAYCKSEFEKDRKHIGGANRSLRLGLNLYCNRKCAVLSRRHNKSDAQKKLEKREYDKKYREKNRERLKIEKASWFANDYKNNPEKYKEWRKKIYKKHLEYLRRPAYRAYKKQYDHDYRAKMHGEFWESWILLQKIDKEIGAKMSNYEIRLKNKTLNKALQRSRNGNTKRSYA